MKYDITFSCGHEGTVSLVGRYDERERKLQWYRETAVCPDCYKKQLAEQKAAEEREHEEAAKAAFENAAAFGWPKLVGSEKQVRWAVTLRQDFYDFCLKRNPTAEGMKKIQSVIDKKQDASTWIDARDNWNEFLRTQLKEMKTSEPASHDIETTVEPKERIHPGAAKISIVGDIVAVSYQRDDNFREVVKSLGYTWNSEKRVWQRKMDKRSGRAEDRAAEVGNALLLAGFAIRAENEFVRSAAVLANFEPECKRWIMLCGSGTFTGSLLVCFPRGDEDAYRAAKMIPGARWSSPYVVLPISEWAAAIEMADMMHFCISDGAKSAIEEYKSHVIIAVPSRAPKQKSDRSPADILNSSRDVLDDLRD